MRRILSVAIIAGVASLLPACSMDSLWARQDAQELANAQFHRLVEAINSGDPEVLKAELSDRAEIEDEDLDTEIARLFELLPDGVWSWRKQACSEGSYSHAGPVEIYVNCGWDIVLDSPTPVSVRFKLYNYNTWDPENLGIYALSVTTGDDAPPQQENDLPWDGPGLYISDSPPVVGGRP